MSLDKRAVAEVIQRDYVDGDKSLRSIAKEVGCSQPRLTQIGNECVPGYAEATARRWQKFINKVRPLIAVSE